MPHQHEAARRIAGSLDIFGGALLSDAVGLGKTYTSLAVATRYKSVVAVVPAVLRLQWENAAAAVGVDLQIKTHEGLSRDQNIDATDLVIVDEAHRFRNTETIRYNRLARDIRSARVLLVTATSVINTPKDLASLLRLFMSDRALSLLGVDGLESAARDRPGNLLRATLPLTVARTQRSIVSLRTSLPAITDGRVANDPPVPPALLNAILQITDTLEFPCFEGGEPGSLLRQHLLYRLASSHGAFIVSLRRHETYLLRALVAAKKGQHLTRREARAIFSEDRDMQLDFLFDMHARTAAQFSTAEVRTELQRITQLMLLAEYPDSPKTNRVVSILRSHPGKTIIFCAAVDTARNLARHMGWTRCAVATGQGALIASGRIALDEVLDLFSPHSRRTQPPTSATEIDTLIATDLVSEGLDLQDASAIINFDLPWTAARLEQRVGRIARLGSTHHGIVVHWFVPPEALERRLCLASRISRKARHQAVSGSPTFSGVGRTRSFNKALELREQLAALGGKPHAAKPLYSVVRGPDLAVFAITWLLDTGAAREILMLQGPSYRVVEDVELLFKRTLELMDAETSTGSPPRTLMPALWRVLRERVYSSYRPPDDSRTIQLTRLALKSAARAGRDRDNKRLAKLDKIVDLLSTGVQVGVERKINDYLQRSQGSDAAELPSPDVRTTPTFLNVNVEAALIGDGTQPLSL